MTIFDLIIGFISFCVGLIVAQFLPSYFKKKGENLATKEDIKGITEKVESVRLKYAEQLEILRAELNSSQSLLLSTIESLRSVNVAFSNKRGDAIKTMWNAVLEARKTASNALTMFELAEISPTAKKEIINSNMAHELIETNKSNYITNGVFKVVKDVEAVRPFLGEELWLVFNQYISYLFMIQHLLVQGIKKGEIKTIDQDSEGIDFVRKIISTSDFDRIIKRTMKTRQIRDILELNIISKLSHIISGKDISDKTIEVAQKLEELRQRMPSKADELSESEQVK